MLYFGVATPTTALTTSFGTFSFGAAPPSQLLMISNSFAPSTAAIFAGPAPWQLDAPAGLNFPFEGTIQAVIEDQPGVLAVTNGFIFAVL